MNRLGACLLTLLILSGCVVECGTPPPDVIIARETRDREQKTFEVINRHAPYGLWVIRDTETGCEYIALYDHSITSRLSSEGKPKCQ